LAVAAWSSSAFGSWPIPCARRQQTVSTKLAAAHRGPPLPSGCDEGNALRLVDWDTPRSKPLGRRPLAEPASADAALSSLAAAAAAASARGEAGTPVVGEI
jgi:hypothetical protein